MKQTKKKRRSRPKRANNKDVVAGDGNGEQSRVLNALMEAFALTTIGEAASAYREANGDVNKAAEILGAMLLETSSEDPFASSSTTDYPSTSSSMTGSSGSSGLGSSSSEGLMEVNAVSGKGFCRGSKGKRVVAATGTVSTVLGKDYVISSPRRDSSMKSKGFGNGHVDKEEAEQFLCSMLGDECELSMAVVRDILCNCGYDIEKALDVLLDLSASSHELSRNVRSFNNFASSNEDTRLLFNHGANLTDRASDLTSHSSESEVSDSVQYMGFPTRSYSKVLAGTEVRLPTSPGRTESNLSQKVLESLFNVSETESCEHDPSTMNWRNVVKKMKSLGQRFDYCPSELGTHQQNNYGKGDEYQMFRESAKEHWDSMTSYYRRAATAYTNGQRGHAAYLSDQGKLQTKMAREADDKASQEIFKARNKSIENVITIDMHGQHVKQAMKLLKLHLLFGTYVSSIQILRVITGCGSHGLGKSKLKQAVVKLVEREGIKWSEENQGTVLIKLEGQRDFSFLDTDSDTE